GFGGAICAVLSAGSQIALAAYAEQVRTGLMAKGVPEWMATAATPLPAGAREALEGGRSAVEGLNNLQINVPNVNVSVGSPADVQQAAAMAAQQVYDQIIS